MARNGRPGPVLLEVPGDMWNDEVPGTDEVDYKPVRRILSAPDAMRTSMPPPRR